MYAFVMWIQQSMFPWLRIAVFAVIALWFLFFAPLFFIKRLRPSIGLGLLYTSYIPGFTCWIFSFVVTYQTLGVVWLVIGLLFMGVGIFPLAVVGVLLHGLWPAMPDLILAIAFVLIPRLIGLWILHRFENEPVPVKNTVAPNVQVVDKTSLASTSA